MGNLYDLFKNEEGEYILISLEELKLKLDFDKWYFTSTKLYNHYKTYLLGFGHQENIEHLIGEEIDVDVLFENFHYLESIRQ